MTEPEDEHEIELVDEVGRAIGHASKRLAHAPPGQLHRAVSVFLLDDSGRLLLQRRALSKYHAAGLWSNTCCGHPAPGEPPVLAAVNRLEAELGLTVAAEHLAEVGTVRYAVADRASGLVEREHNHLFVGRLASPPRPAPSEVAEVMLVGLAELGHRIDAAQLSPWFEIVLDAAMPGLIDAIARDDLLPNHARRRPA